MDRDFVTHGICTGCRDRVIAESGQSLERFIASLPEPVLLLDDDARVVALNSKALPDPTACPETACGRLLGDVYECAYAGLPGGCGRTIHCAGCTIRSTVEDTYRSGETHLRIPATLRPADPEGAEPVALQLSTVKIGKYVMLRIETWNDPPRK